MNHVSPERPRNDLVAPARPEGREASVHRVADEGVERLGPRIVLRRGVFASATNEKRVHVVEVIGGGLVAAGHVDDLELFGAEPGPLQEARLLLGLHSGRTPALHEKHLSRRGREGRFHHKNRPPPPGPDDDAHSMH